MMLSLALSLTLLQQEEPPQLVAAPPPPPPEVEEDAAVQEEVVVLEVPQLGAVDTSHLHAKLLVAHPGLFSGDYDQVRRDWMTALQADRTSPLAAFTAQRLADLDIDCTEGLDPAALAEMIEGIDDGDAAFALKKLYLREMRRSRFADVRPTFADDLFDDWFTHWRVLNGWGPLAPPQPMRVLADPPDPRTLTPIDPETGVEQRWRSLKRNPNRTLVSPDRFAHLQAGTSYAALWLRADVEVAKLELHASEAFRAWWNGMPTFEDLHEGLTTADRIHRALIRVQPGWNLLLVEYETGSDLRLGGRLLSREGHILPYHEWEDPSASPDLPQIPMPVEAYGLQAYRPAETDAYAQMLRVEMDILDQHPERGLALATPGGMEAAEEAAWLFSRYRVMSNVGHLPNEIRRSRLMALEQDFRDRGMFVIEAQLAHVQRLSWEDKADEALEAIREVLAIVPDHYRARITEAEILQEIDTSGTLAKPLLLALHERYPKADEPLSLLQDLAEERGDRASEMALARKRMRVDGDEGSALIPLLIEGTEAERAEAESLIRRLLAEEPRHASGIHYRDRLWRTEGNHARLLAEREKEVARQPDRPQPLVRYGRTLLEQGKVTAALEQFEKARTLDPADPDLRDIVQRLSGQADAAEVFFTAFGPDAEAQLAKRGEIPRNNSTAMLLDSGMVYFLPDGSYLYRTDNLHIALDRRGTEILHELPVSGEPLLAQVLDAEGTVVEPHQVDESWVMPSLDPGDVIATSYLREVRGVPGHAPNAGNWRFSSLEEDFTLSRWVLFIPDGLPGRLVEHDFDGTHEILDWEGGKVHVFEKHDSAKIEPEVLMPAANEILPWVVWGDDQPLEWEAEDWRRWFLWQTSIPADIELELRDFLSSLALTGTSLERAQAIYAAVDEEIIEFGGSGDVTDLWTLKRGDPTYFLSALFTLAEIPHEWAAIQSVAPDLVDEPNRPFRDGKDYDIPALRISDLQDGGEVAWIAPQSRGTAFGSLPAQMLGSEAMVLEPEGFRMETVSRDGLEDIWDLDYSVSLVIQPDESAAVEGTIRITGSQGAGVREQIAQISPMQRDQAVRQITAQLVKGLDLSGSELPDLETAGAPLTLEFTGTIPDFVQKSGDKYGARLRIPELGLGDGLGPAERSLPFVFPQTMRVKVHVQLDTNGTWLLDYGPTDVRREEEGFLYDFRVQSDEHHLSVDRVLEMRGLELSPEEFQGFVADLKDFENQESRAVRLAPDLPEPEPVLEDVPPEYPVDIEMPEEPQAEEEPVPVPEEPQR